MLSLALPRFFAPSALLLAASLLLAGAAQAQLRAPGTPAPQATPSLGGNASNPAPSLAANAPAAPQDAAREAAGRLAAQGWLQLLDRGDWGTAWDAAGSGFKQTVPLATWMENIPKVRQPLGALQQREAGETVYKTQLPGRPAGHYVSVSFASTFANGQVLELVTTALDADGRFRVLGYSYTPR